MNPSITVVIPARLGSTRFPEKVLASATGRPLIQHVYEAARGSKVAGRVVIATDHNRVLEAAKGFGAEALMTSPDHTNGTSRLAETAALLSLGPDDIVVNVQGDEPELDPSLVDAAVGKLLDSGAPVSTVASPFSPGEDPANPNIVKVVMRLDGTALYFSRALVPHNRDGGGTPAHQALKHVGLYCYRVAFLRKYITLTETPMERLEKLEQLRVLEHGFDIAVAVRSARHQGIDTPEQYAAFVERWKAAHRA